MDKTSKTYSILLRRWMVSWSLCSKGKPHRLPGPLTLESSFYSTLSIRLSFSLSLSPSLSLSFSSLSLFFLLSLSFSFSLSHALKSCGTLIMFAVYTAGWDSNSRKYLRGLQRTSLYSVTHTFIIFFCHGGGVCKLTTIFWSLFLSLYLSL